MTAIVIKPKNKEEETFLKELLKKMNIDTLIVEEPTPNYETIRAIEDVEKKKGTHVKDSGELFSQLGI
jgi:antitoxin component of RelBE/YafQ-DinJ toxin-antitoxin module